MSEIPTNYSDALEQYNIVLKSLQKQTYTFQYTLDEMFFALFPNASIQKGKIQVDLQLQKRSTIYHLFFNFDGTIDIACDRCLNSIDWPIDMAKEVIVKLVGSARMDNEDNLDIIYITPEHMQINVAQLLYEFIILSLPIKRTCDGLAIPISCDEKVIAILEGREENNRSESKEEDIDPRWAILKKLKKKE